MNKADQENTETRRVILVRHSEPLVDATLPAPAWPLSAKGAADAATLANALRPYTPGLVVTSSERKAIETGRIMARLLGIDRVTDEDLIEQGLGTAPFFPDRAAFLAHVRDHFRRPNEPVLGAEPAIVAADRFANAVERHTRADAPPPILVSHGRVMASYLARLTGQDPWVMWESLTMLDAYVAKLDPPGRMLRVGRI